MKSTKTLKVRVKDNHAHLLNKQAKAINFVCNDINELSSRSIKERGVFLSEFDLHPYTKGTGSRGVGIDVGCKDTATDSIGREYRQLAPLLGLAQRAKNKKRVKLAHAKIVRKVG